MMSLLRLKTNFKVFLCPHHVHGVILPSNFKTINTLNSIFINNKIPSIISNQLFSTESNEKIETNESANSNSNDLTKDDKIEDELSKDNKEDNLNVNEPSSSLSAEDYIMTSDHIHWIDWIKSDIIRPRDLSHSEQTKKELENQPSYTIPNLKVRPSQIQWNKFVFQDKNNTKLSAGGKIALTHSKKKFDYERHDYFNSNSKSDRELQCKERNNESKDVVRKETSFNSEIEPIKNEDSVSSIEQLRFEEKRSVLQPPLHSENIDILGPEVRSTYNPASYINRSPTLQKLVDLGVDLSKWEEDQNLLKKMLSLDFDRDIKNYIVFLVDQGISADKLGRFFTKNPGILSHSIDDLETRINYLKSKKFSTENIVNLVTRNPFWLNQSVLEVDQILGFMQKLMKLSGGEVRSMILDVPRIINLRKIDIKACFLMLTDFGFGDIELKRILVNYPYILTKNISKVTSMFEYVHTEIGISHKSISRNPRMLTYRQGGVRERHLFLKHIERDQYDPTKPNYISPKALYSGTDTEFCMNVAKTSLDIMNNFLKTL